MQYKNISTLNKSFKDIQIDDLLQGENKNANAFNVSYITLPPGERTQEHRHDEKETFFFIQGTGNLEYEGHSIEIGPGDLVHFDSFESHTVINRCDEPLLFISIYWRDYQEAYKSAHSQEAKSNEPTYITSGPPTPNGDLHLGHLAGPLIAADVCARYLKMRGKEVYNISWSDDFQTAVMDKSHEIGKKPEDVADFYSNIILETIQKMNIDFDIYLRPVHSLDYQKEFADFFSRLWKDGVFVNKKTLQCYDSFTKTFIHEGGIRGYCGNCREECSGNLCEECGHPHSTSEVLEPISALSNNKPLFKELKQLYLPLSGFIENIRDHHNHSVMRSRLRVLFAQLCEKQLQDFPVTYPGEWGVEVPIEQFKDQKISVWFEMAFAFLYCIKEIEKNKGSCDTNISLPEEGRIIHFFGFDNSFYYTILFPAVYFASFPNKKLKIDYICNEFYYLDNSKFSTSKEHAVWGQEILKIASSDQVRLFLAYTRPEEIETNFTLEEFYSFIQIKLGILDKWLSDLNSKMNHYFDRLVPEAGLWSHEQIGYFSLIGNYITLFQESYELKSFSIKKVANLIFQFVEDTCMFFEGEKHWSTTGSTEAYFRTAIALEVTAANILAMLAFPLVPEFSSNLWTLLGNSESLEKLSWPKTPPFAQAGSIVNLDDLPSLSELRKIDQGVL